MKKWAQAASLAAGDQTMYVANGAMLAAWDAPGGIRPTQRWQLNVDEVLAVSGVIDSTLSLDSVLLACTWSVKKGWARVRMGA